VFMLLLTVPHLLGKIHNPHSFETAYNSLTTCTQSDHTWPFSPCTYVCEPRYERHSTSTLDWDYVHHLYPFRGSAADTWCSSSGGVIMCKTTKELHEEFGECDLEKRTFVRVQVGYDNHLERMLAIALLGLLIATIVFIISH
jgi:hypothetical protein